MSKIFFDQFVELEEIKVYIDNVSESCDEKTDLWDLVDEYINNKIIFIILSRLEESYHDEFLGMFLKRPYDLDIINYLNSKLPVSFEEIMLESKKQLLTDLCGLLEILPEVEKKAGKKLGKTKTSKKISEKK